jgi:hypothetical protein
MYGYHMNPGRRFVDAVDVDGSCHLNTRRIASVFRSFLGSVWREQSRAGRRCPYADYQKLMAATNRGTPVDE